MDVPEEPFHIITLLDSDAVVAALRTDIRESISKNYSQHFGGPYNALSRDFILFLNTTHESEQYHRIGSLSPDNAHVLGVMDGIKGISTTAYRNI